MQSTFWPPLRSQQASSRQSTRKVSVNCIVIEANNISRYSTRNYRLNVYSSLKYDGAIRKVENEKGQLITISF